MVGFQLRRLTRGAWSWVLPVLVFGYLTVRVMMRAPWSNGPGETLGWYDVIQAELLPVAVLVPVYAAFVVGSRIASDSAGFGALSCVRGRSAFSYVASMVVAGWLVVVGVIGSPIAGATVVSWMVAPAVTSNSPAPPLPSGFPSDTFGVIVSITGAVVAGAVFYVMLGAVVGLVVRRAALVPVVVGAFHLVVSFAAPPRWSPYSNMTLEVGTLTVQSVLLAWLAVTALGAIALSGLARRLVT
ncbi:MAG: hypothetical protein OEX04_09320 [Acidimicrobiia bacterium]|nr:hypothetical protein [Acidimicrobiia bacterium]MDH4307665.1 hypothetical protein [Acidimicrobiia bacterium]